MPWRQRCFIKAIIVVLPLVIIITECDAVERGEHSSAFCFLVFCLLLSIYGSKWRQLSRVVNGFKCAQCISSITFSSKRKARLCASVYHCIPVLLYNNHGIEWLLVGALSVCFLFPSSSSSPMYGGCSTHLARLLTQDYKAMSLEDLILFHRF